MAGSKVQIGRRLGRIGRLGRRRLPRRSLGLSIRLRPRYDLLQHRILLQFLFDQRLEFQRGRLQKRQRLLELRRQHQRLRQPLRQL